MTSLTMSASLGKVAVPVLGARKTTKLRRAAVKVKANLWPVSVATSRRHSKGRSLPAPPSATF